jgi:hypothetical protein
MNVKNGPELLMMWQIRETRKKMKEEFDMMHQRIQMITCIKQNQWHQKLYYTARARTTVTLYASF